MFKLILMHIFFTITKVYKKYIFFFKDFCYDIRVNKFRGRGGIGRRARFRF